MSVFVSNKHIYVQFIDDDAEQHPGRGLDAEPDLRAGGRS